MSDELLLLDSFQRQDLFNIAYAAFNEMRRPVHQFNPKLFIDGNQYCFLLGDDLQSGCAGFGDTVELAAYDFDKNFSTMTLNTNKEATR